MAGQKAAGQEAAGQKAAGQKAAGQKNLEENVFGRTISGECLSGESSSAPISSERFSGQNDSDENIFTQNFSVGNDSDSRVQSQAHVGHPDAIACYLSEALEALGIAVRAKVDRDEHRANSAIAPDSLEANSLPGTTALKRLLVVCESAYPPDPSLLADLVAQRLRELELKGFRDAVVFGQVSGEYQPEWMLRVDLTPPDEILQEWARWGDVQAIARLLNRLLAPQQICLSALLKDTTLHLTCGSTQGTIPEQAAAIAAIEPLLQSFNPQGILSATIYGVTSGPTQPITDASPTEPSVNGQPNETPHWVHWLNLSASSQPDLAPSTLDLARQGNLAALTFLLNRLLNSNLDTKLATGGLRVQIRQKGDLLHIMAEAPNCPRQDAIGPTVVRFLKPLQIASVSGIRVYGRRSGQKHPLWNYGLDFVSRNRLVPEATPEFAASDAHVDDLLAPPGEIVLWSELPASDWRSSMQHLFDEVIGQVQRSLIRTQLFIPGPSASLGRFAENTHSSHPSIKASGRQKLGIALVWGTVGVLMAVQTDWVLGYWLKSDLLATSVSSGAPTSSGIPTSSGQAIATNSKRPAPSPSQMPEPLLNKPKAEGWSDFNSSSFTQSGKTVLVPQPPEQPGAGNPNSDQATNPATTGKLFAASPLQAKADSLPNLNLNYPSFNSRQLDRQLAVYQQYLEVNGPPDVLVLGSSRALRGVDPVALKEALAQQGHEGVKVFNLGVNGATVQVVDWLVRQVLPQEKLPKLILFADGARAFNSGRLDITYNGVMASEGYRTLAAGTPPIAGSTVAHTVKPQPQVQTGTSTAVTETVPVNVTSPYQRLNDSLNQRLQGFSMVYSHRDRLKGKLRESLSALLPKGSISSVEVLASSDSLMNSASPAAAATSAPALAADGQGMIDIEGFLPLSVQFNPVTYYQKYARVPGDYDSDYESFNLDGVQTNALETLAQFLKQRQISLVFVNLPLTQEYLDPIRRQHEEAFQQHMQALAPQIGILYRDLGGALTTQPDYFSDPSHLNRYGAYEVSHRLAQDVMIPWQVAK
jgi:hypothetical protein